MNKRNIVLPPQKYMVRVTSTQEGKLNFAFINSDGNNFIFGKNVYGATVITLMIRQFSKNGKTKYLGISDKNYFDENGSLFGPYTDLNLLLSIEYDEEGCVSYSIEDLDK